MGTARRQLGYVSSLTTQTSFVAGDCAATLYEFTTIGANSWTVPAGVTYVIANIQAGGGAAWMGGTAGTSGGDSSVAFASGTITASGGTAMGSTNTTFSNNALYAFTPDVYGAGGRHGRKGGSPTMFGFSSGHQGAYLRAGGAVTPGSSLTITVGAGGGITGSTYGAAGKQGIVILEAYEGNNKRCDVFTTTGTFNPPLGVDSVTATLIGGGGSTAQGDWSANAGGNTTAAFTSGTVTALGGKAQDLITRLGFEQWQVYPLPTNNSGQGGRQAWAGTSGPSCIGDTQAGNGQYVVVQRAVSYGTGVTVTIGSGGAGSGGTSSGGASGCSGVAWIEYEV